METKKDRPQAIFVPTAGVVLSALCQVGPRGDDLYLHMPKVPSESIPVLSSSVSLLYHLSCQLPSFYFFDTSSICAFLAWVESIITLLWTFLPH